MRWRYNSDGKVESNAKLVKWEDDTYTLFIGEEALEVRMQPNSNLQTYERFRDMYYFKQDVPEKVMFKPCSIKSRMHIRRLENVLNPVKTTKVLITSDNPEVEKKRREQEREQHIKDQVKEDVKANLKLEDFFEGDYEQSSEEEEPRRRAKEAEPRKRRKYDEDSSEESSDE
jgi:hypothetical protein